MDVSSAKYEQGRRVVQAGALLFLIAVVFGFLVPRVSLPRVGLSAHLVGVMQGLLLLTIGQLWPRLALGPAWSRAASVLAVGGCYCAWSGNALAASWGAGGALLPQAAGGARGSELEELVLLLLLRGGGLALVTGWLVILWGLRTNPGTTNER